MIQGYRHGTWSGGRPHLSAEERQRLGARIGTVTWSKLATEWPGLKKHFRQSDSRHGVTDSTPACLRSGVRAWIEDVVGGRDRAQGVQVLGRI